MPRQALDSLLRLPARLSFWLALALVGLCTYVFWPTLLVLREAWTKPDYSHGFLVPVFAAYLLYRRREMLTETSEGSWFGLAFLGLAGVIRLAGAFFAFEYADAFALLPCVAGLILLFGGWRALHWGWPAVLFLLFMLPLPYQVANGLSHPLRRVATKVAGVTLETFGLPVVVEGFTIHLDDHQIGVEEVCSGLGMLYVFIALSTAVAFLIERPWLDRLLILLSAAPIAIFANVARITATAFAFWWGGKELGDMIFHDLGGWLMMPLALVLLWLELKLIDLFLVPAEDERDSIVPDLVASLAGMPVTGVIKPSGKGQEPKR